MASERIRAHALWRTRPSALAATAALVACLCVSPLLSHRGARVTGASDAVFGCEASWPMYQHDPLHNATACSSVSKSNAPLLRASWFFSTGQQAVTAEPALHAGQLYVGDAGGTFYDVDASTGAERWRFSILSSGNSCGGRVVAPDRHLVSYGEITSSAAVSDLAGSDPIVFFGGGGTLYALDAVDGRCLWARDLDPSNATSSMEILSSPVVDSALSRPEVIVGDDSNESPGSSAPPGVQAFDARSGALLWKFEPERLTVVGSLESPSDTDGCGDVWSSPALDPFGLDGAGLVFFGTGNCPDPASVPPGDPTVEGVFALSATTGMPAWPAPFYEPANQYAGASRPDGGDDDFGSSPMVVPDVAMPDGRLESLVIQAGKSGYLYALDERNGSAVWSVQAAQPGQSGDSLAGAIGGFIGSGAIGQIARRPTVFIASAIPTPFKEVTNSGATLDTGLLCIDGDGSSMAVGTSSTCDPLRAASLHAVDVGTGKIDWQAPTAVPSYAATSYAGGVLFAPSTTSFSEQAYDASSGLALWSVPLGAAPSSGTAIAGSNVYFGAGTGGLAPGSSSFPPQADGVWGFTVEPAPSS